ncbi:MAG: S1 RNA-binding domain-containing protein [Candidatus Paraimprobicoccus trichonymphae]|uniref:S1 RNA-binding domain-containing protein n=1 Tax=Candidatus Paraimprobicoccus trichonymphae TaxID=3033793 RepID=A0AA48IHD2_9FIRM|nr:MAG: S1 RNA-binding domain-containing protein [Candidatus Paraimprobicoccus trichonymphae]
MGIENENIVEGIVRKIVNFGAFIELPNGKTGLVHISEVSNNFVRNVNDYLEVGQKVKVKVLNLNDGGKIALSIKQTLEEMQDRRMNSISGGQNPDFENLISKYKKQSDETLTTLNKRVDRY